jgi:hypothetical protein
MNSIGSFPERDQSMWGWGGDHQAWSFAAQEPLAMSNADGIHTTQPTPKILRPTLTVFQALGYFEPENLQSLSSYVGGALTHSWSDVLGVLAQSSAASILGEQKPCVSQDGALDTPKSGHDVPLISRRC